MAPTAKKNTSRKRGASASSGARPQRIQRAAPITAHIEPAARDLGRDTVVSLRLVDFAESVGARVTSVIAPPSVVRRDLLRYYEIMEHARHEVCPSLESLDDDWLALMRGACDGVAFSSEKQVRALWAFAAVAFAGHEFEDEALRLFRDEYSIPQLYAIVDMMESERERAPSAPMPAVEPEAQDTPSPEVSDG